MQKQREKTAGSNKITMSDYTRFMPFMAWKGKRLIFCITLCVSVR